MEFVTIVGLCLIVVIWIGFLIHIIFKIIDNVKNKKREREQRHKWNVADNIKREKERCARQTIQKFIDNMDSINPIILEDGTKIKIEKKINYYIGDFAEYYVLKYEIDGQEYEYCLRNVYGDVLLDYREYSFEYLGSNEWVIDQIVKIVEAKQNELHNRRIEEYVLKSEIAFHDKVKKVGK